MAGVPSVFVVILNYNGGSDLMSCLESVYRTKYPNYSVVLVDNGSSDGSFQEAKKRFPQAFFIENAKNLGFAAGNNVAIRFSLENGADYVLLLNNDTLVEADFLEHLEEAFFRNPSAGVASPVIFDREGGIWFFGGKIDWFKMRTEHFFKISGGECFSEFITGCAMMVRREVFEKIGLLDERFFLYYEDADFSLRSRAAGFENMVVSDSKVWHLEKSQNDSESKTYWLVFSGLVFFQKNSSLLWRFWQFFYIKARRIKNWLDVKFRPNKVNSAVRRAYRDFKKYGNE